MEDENKIKSIDDQIKALQEKKAKLIKEQREKEKKQRIENAVTIFAILESIGIDTVKKAESLKLFLQENRQFEELLLTFNVTKISSTDENKAGL